MESIRQFNPFYYPKETHRRTERPKQYKRHQAYKPYLKIEFANKCVYCRKPDYLQHYTVDHYKPKRLFPELEAEYSNLYYCCPDCNSRKGTFWPTGVQRKRGEYIPNPCDHTMFEHLQFRHPSVAAKTAAGKHAEYLLQLNSDSALDMRDTLLRSIKGLIEKANYFERILLELRGRMERESDEGLITQIQSDVETTEREREGTLKALRTISGAY